METEKTREAVRRTVGERPEEVEEIDEGLIHETYSVKVDGRELIVQFSGDEEDSSSLEHNIRCYELFQDTVPVPEPLTEQVETLEGKKFIVVENLPGETAESDITPEKTLEAGKALAKIHDKASFPHEGWMDLKQEDSTPEELLEGLELHRFEKGSLRRRKLDNMYSKKIPTLRENGFEVAEEVEGFLRENESLFPKEFTAVPVHIDFSPDNVLFQEEKLTGVIDFDYMYAGLDVRDLAKSANSFWMHNPDADWNIRQKFYKGYRKIRELPENFEELEAFFRIETLARLIASVIELDEMTEEEIEFYQGELKEELEKSKKKLENT